MSFNYIKVDLKSDNRKWLQEDGGLGKTKPSLPRGETILTIIYGARVHLCKFWTLDEKLQYLLECIIRNSIKRGREAYDLLHALLGIVCCNWEETFHILDPLLGQKQKRTQCIQNSGFSGGYPKNRFLSHLTHVLMAAEFGRQRKQGRGLWQVRATEIVKYIAGRHGVGCKRIWAQEKKQEQAA